MEETGLIQLVEVDETELGYSSWSQWWLEKRVVIGKLINSYIDPIKEIEFIEHRYYVNKARSPGDRLTKLEIKKYSQYMLDVQDRDMRRSYFETQPLESTFQGLIIPLIKELMDYDSSIKRFVNIGVNYAYIDGLLAKKYPNVEFTGVDFAKNVADFNEEFTQENLNFKSGYALEMLEKGELDCDIVMTSSVSYEIKNAEIRAYFKAMAKHCRYIIMNEPIYLLPGGEVVDPDDVPPDDAKPVYSYQGRKRRQPGPLALVHNYRAMLEAENFEILHYRVFRPTFTDVRMINIIAKVKTEG